jgi:hypothetical protein
VNRRPVPTLVPTRVRALVPALATAALLAGCGAGPAVVGVRDVPAAVTTTAPLDARSADRIAQRVLAAADAAASVPAAEAKEARAAALTGGALAVAGAVGAASADQASALEPLVRTAPPKVLAVSRGTGWPRVILAQTTAADGAAELNVLVSPDARTPFRLSASATMHPGATVSALDPLPQGAPLVVDGSGLATAPTALFRDYAAALAFPKPAAPRTVSLDDPFSTAVRANAAAQAKAFGALAVLTRKHSVVPDTTVAIRLKDGGALVFTLMLRTDTITLKKGGKSLTPSPEVQRLVRKRTLARSAELRTYESLVFTVPAEGPASVVAVDEVLASAKGS